MVQQLFSDLKMHLPFTAVATSDYYLNSYPLHIVLAYLYNTLQRIIEETPVFLQAKYWTIGSS